MVIFHRFSYVYQRVQDSFPFRTDTPTPPHRPRIGIGRFGCADRSQLDLPGSMVAAALHVPQGWDQTLGMEDTRPGKHIEKTMERYHFLIGKSTISTGPCSINSFFYVYQRVLGDLSRMATML